MTENNETPQKNGESLGLAGGMARAFIHSPLSPLLFFVMLVVGVLGLIFTPRQEDPQISVPMVDIFVKYPGASSEQVASLAIDPLQRLMSEIPGVKHVFSVSRHGEGMVTVQFIVGEKLGPSIVKVHDKLQSNLDKIPPGVSMPLVKPKGIDDVPVVTLTLWSKDLDDGALRTLSLDLLQSLKQIPNTGQGFVVGGRPEQVRVEVMPERLAGYGVSLAQVAQTIRTANSEKRAGDLENGGGYFTVYTGSFLHTADDVERLVVSVHDGIPVYVRDVARVIQQPADPEQLVDYYTGPAFKGKTKVDGVPAVTIALAKKEGANGVTVANAIIDKVNSLKGQLIPDNVHVAVTRNYGKTANDKVNELIFKLFVATAAVALLVWLSLGMRPALVVLFVIPVVILVTVFAAWILGYTIDRVSLFALIFSIGILVDDAIVVVENIYRRWLGKGKMDSATAVDAVREVGNPTILATFTVIAALLPMGFVSGMMGPYMEPIPALGSVAMLFSLFAAFIFTPWLAMRIRPSMEQLRKGEVREHQLNDRLERFFRKLLLPIIENRRIGWMVIGGIVVAFFLSCAMFYTTAVTVKMLPFDNKPEFSVVLDMADGTALPVTANVVSQMAEKLRTIPEVTALQSYIGTSQPFDFNGMVRHYYLRDKPWQADLHIQLLDKDKRHRSSHDIAVAARALLEPIAKAANARLTVVEMPPGPPVLQSIVAEVYGPTAGVRREVAKDMTKMFRKADGIADVTNYMERPHDVWRFEVDTEKAVRRGISVDTINRNLSMAMGGFKLGDVKQGTVLDPTYIVLQVPLQIRAQIDRLGDLPIPAPDGTMVPLTELGHFVKMPQDPVIYHKDLRPVEYVVGDAVGRLGAPIYGMSAVERLLAKYKAPDGVKLSGEYLGPPASDAHSDFAWTGEWTVTYETFRDMGAAFAVALVLIYILVVWEFSNFLIPLVIMAPIPLTLIGIIPGHWIVGHLAGTGKSAEFTATSMIGFIALAGIIVRNSILLVDFSKHQVERGLDVRDAVVLACKTRTRPILITALALVAGSSVILFDPIFQGMAISLLFGVLVSTLLTLVVIPLGCISARGAFCPAEKGNCGGQEDESGRGGRWPSPKSPIGPKIAGAAMLAGVVIRELLRDLARSTVKAVRGVRKGVRSVDRHFEPAAASRVTDPMRAGQAVVGAGMDLPSVPLEPASAESSLPAAVQAEPVTDSGLAHSDPVTAETTVAAVEPVEPEPVANAEEPLPESAPDLAETNRFAGIDSMGIDSMPPMEAEVVAEEPPSQESGPYTGLDETGRSKEPVAEPGSVAGNRTAPRKKIPRKAKPAISGQQTALNVPKKSAQPPSEKSHPKREPTKGSSAKGARRGIRLKPGIGRGTDEPEQS